MSYPHNDLEHPCTLSCCETDFTESEMEQMQDEADEAMERYLWLFDVL